MEAFTFNFVLCTVHVLSGYHNLILVHAMYEKPASDQSTWSNLFCLHVLSEMLNLKTSGVSYLFLSLQTKLLTLDIFPSPHI